MTDDEEMRGDEMLPAERRTHLIDWFKANTAGSSQDLARLFNISVSTVRRDLDLLAGEGIVRRTHGGAVLIRSQATWEPSTELSRRTAVEEKQAIVHEAMKLLQPHQSLLIDTGAVVCHRLAEEIAKIDIPLTVITNDLHVANVLTYRENISLIVPGGSSRFGSYSLLGEPGVSFLETINCDIFFTSAAAVDETCVSETHFDLVHLKQAMMNAASRVVLLADSSRFMSRALYRTATIDRVDLIITDTGVTDEDRARFPPQKPHFVIADI